MTDTLTPAKIKKLLSDPKNRIELHDVVHKETERIYSLIKNMDPHDKVDATVKAKAWMEKMEEETKTLRDLFSYGCYFGSEDQAYLWTKSLNRLGNLPHSDGLQVMINLQLYAAMLVMYAGGVSAIAANNLDSLKALLTPRYQLPHRGQAPLITQTHGWLLDQNVANAVLGLERHHTPMSDRVHDIISATYPEELLVTDEFAQEYDRWEIILCMAIAHHNITVEEHEWAPVGRFAWRRQNNGNAVIEIIESEIERTQADWPPLKIKLFGGSKDSALNACQLVKKQARHISF